jgi:hypothetical protein
MKGMTARRRPADRRARTGSHALDRRYDFSDVDSLIERKRDGERATVDAGLSFGWLPRIEHLFTRLDTERETSVLPEEPPNEREVREWLLAVRRSRF